MNPDLSRSTLGALQASPQSTLWQHAYSRYHDFWITLAKTAQLSHDEAEDALHAVLLSILDRNERTFESLDHVRNYVARAVINRAIEYKKNAWRAGEWRDEEEEEEELGYDAELESNGNDEMMQLLRSGFATLPVAHFEILKLRFFAGFTFQEISEMLGVPISTLKSREEAALKRIRQHLRKNGF